MKNSRTINILADFMDNPLLVKELRQTVKANFIIGIMLCVLGILILMTWIMVVDYTDRVSMSNTLGKDFFGGLLVFLAIILWGVVPLTQYFKASKEKDPDEPDLMFITVMKPWKLVLGKYYTAIAQIAIYLSFFLPFMIMCYLFKGLDVYSIGRAIVQLLVMSFIFAQIAVLLGSIPKRKFLLFTFAGALAFAVFMMIVLMVEELLPGIYRSYSYTRIDPFWNRWGLLAALVLFVMLSSLTHSLMMPDTANRALGPRIIITVIYLVSFPFAWYYSIAYKEWQILLVWGLMVTILACVAFIFAISERDVLSVRITRTIPCGFKRWLVFPYYSGSLSGITWSVLILISSNLLLYCGVEYYKMQRSGIVGGFNLSSIWDDYSWVALGFFPGVFMYGMIVFFITRVIGNDSLKKFSWLITAIVLASTFFFSVILVEEFDWDKALYLINPFGPFMVGEIIYRQSDNDATALFIAIVQLLVLALVSVLSLRFLLPQFSRFKRHETAILGAKINPEPELPVVAIAGAVDGN